jgi:hypothetical protein
VNATGDKTNKTGSSPAPGTSDGNTAVPHQGDHDRVQMLSLKADGTPDQHNPEIIGDPEFAKAAAREQFTQQAVSAADSIRATSVPMMTVSKDDGTTELRPASEAPQDPEIQKAQDEHEKVAEAARKAADSMVDALHADSSSTGKDK